MGYRVINTQNNDKSNIKVQQGGKEYAFEICNDGGYRQRMAQSYDNMVHNLNLIWKKGLPQPMYLGLVWISLGRWRY